jgi:hypothetical protein
VTIPEVSRETQKKFGVRVSRGMTSYVGVQLALVSLVTSGLLVFAKGASSGLVPVVAVLVLVELVAWGALLEGKPWGVGLSLGRIAATLAVVGWFTRGMAAAPAAIAVVAGVSLVAGAWVVRYRRPAGPGGGTERVATAP